MCETKASTAKGVAIGMISGIAVGFGVKMLMETSKRDLRKKTNKMISAVENLADSAKDIFQ